MTDTCFPPDDCEFLLWGRLYADLCYGDDYAYRVHAWEVFVRRRFEQSLSKHTIVHWWYCRCSADFSDWKWLALYYPWALDLFQCFGHLGNEAFRAAVARKDGPRT